MGRSRLSVEQTREMFIYVSERIEASRDRLTQADKAIGDGDHGVGMARGFKAVRQRLEIQEYSTVQQLLQAVGMALMSSVGGAAGAIFGTWFRAGAKGLEDQDTFDTKVLALMLVDGVEAVKQRGKAEVGDKTMVDALEPAALKAQQLSSTSLEEALPAVAEAAAQGIERTKDFVAAMGKAKPLGERAIGHPDPGAISTYLILKFMTNYIEQLDEKE